MNGWVAVLLSIPAMALADGIGDCNVVAGRAHVAITFEAPAHPSASAVTLILEYPPSIAIPGKGTERRVGERVKTSLSNATITANDGEHGLRLVLTRAAGIASGDVATVEVDRCEGTPPSTADPIHCRVEAAGSATGFVTPVACSARLLP